jgi:hypothetical protein
LKCLDRYNTYIAFIGLFVIYIIALMVHVNSAIQRAKTTREQPRPCSANAAVITAALRRMRISVACVFWLAATGILGAAAATGTRPTKFCFMFLGEPVMCPPFAHEWWPAFANVATCLQAMSSILGGRELRHAAAPPIRADFAQRTSRRSSLWCTLADTATSSDVEASSHCFGMLLSRTT